MDKIKESTIVDDHVYNLIQATATKLEGLAAYNKYAQDGDHETWQALRRSDEEAVKQLLGKLKECSDGGQLQAGSLQGSQGSQNKGAQGQGLQNRSDGQGSSTTSAMSQGSDGANQGSANLPPA